MRTYNGYYIKPMKETPSLYVVVTEGKGGKVPDVLTGAFTSHRVAMDEIDRYLATKTKKEPVNAEAISQG